MAARARGGCARCGGTKRRRRSQRRTEVLIDCQVCLDPVCVKHVRWDTAHDRWRCVRCEKEESA